VRIQGKYIVLSAFVLALLVSPFAIAAGEGDPLEGGTRNPSNNQAQALTRETEVIANTNTYGTRQSNKSDNGGGAVYGCRSRAGGIPAGNEPCLRGSNLNGGQAFSFGTTGNEAGRIEATGGDEAKPFTTNATGVATGLNADRVDGRSGDELAQRFAAVAQDGTLAGGRGATAARRVSEGTYDVDFNGNIRACARQATIAELENAGSIGTELVDDDTVRVRTRNGGGPEGDGPTAVANKPFHLLVFC